MSTWVGIKVMAELVTALGGLIFLSGLALRGKARDVATGLGAALIGLSGVTILLECVFGVLDRNQYVPAIFMLLFGAGVTIDMVRKDRRPA